MDIPALLVTPAADNLIFTFSRLRLDGLRTTAIDCFNNPSGPVYVIHEADLAKIRNSAELEAIYKYQGMLTTTGLSRLFPEPAQPTIAAVRTSYTGAGRAAQGLGAFLKKTGARRFVSIIVVENETFEELAEDSLVNVADFDQWSANTACPGCREAEEKLCSLPNLLVPIALLKCAQRYFGRTPEAVLVRRLIMMAVRTPLPVLILGPSGTGKEIIARAIHQGMVTTGVRSKTAPFLPLNCAGFPPELLESELFGHKAGSFTGAIQDKDGLWRAAGDGVLFLDEIGDLPPYQQAKILRALEHNEIRPIGSAERIKVSARVITATNKDLPAMVRAGLFRADLYHRLKGGIPIVTAALHDHPEDISDIAQHCWRRIWEEVEGSKIELDVPCLSEDALEALRTYQWPGNVRELKYLLSTVRHMYPQGPWNRGEIEAALRATDVRSRGRLTLPRIPDLVWRHLDDAAAEVRRCHLAMQHLWDCAGVTTSDDRLQSTVSESVKVLNILCERPAMFGSGQTRKAVEEILRALTPLAEMSESSLRVAVIQEQAALSAALEQALEVLLDEAEQWSGVRQAGWSA